MSIRYILLALLGALAIPAAAQPDSRPDHAERIRPTIEKWEKRDRNRTPPYLMQTGRPVENPYFLNRPTIVEPAGASQPQNESSIAINPLRPNVLFASAVDYRNGAWAYISTDAGRTWRNVSLGDVRPGWPSGNDPSVAFDHLGNGYVMYGALVRGNTDPTKNGQSGIYLSKTTDDGVSWTKHIAVIEHQGVMTADSVLEDKYYIEIDRSTASPHLGWMYTPWKRVTDRDSATQIMFARSTDGGLTWGAPVAISPRKPRTSLDTTFGQSFPLAATGPDGTVYVVWHDGPIRSIGFARSSDGGLTFTAPRYVVQGNRSHGTPKKVGADVYHVLKNTFRAETYPTLMADNSSSPRRGWLYLAWASGEQPNVYFSRSTDKGETWTSPRIIHSDTTNDQWWPWLAVDPMNGDIAVMYSDSRHDTANILVDQYVSYSSDGGDTWIDRRATDAMSDYRMNPFQNGIFAGDYSGVAFRSGRVYPSFLDTRTDEGRRDNDVYTSIINTRQPLPVDSLRAIIDPIGLTSLDLRWALPATMTSVFGHPIASYTVVVERDSVPYAVLPAGSTTIAETGLVIGQLYTYHVSIATPTDTSLARVLAVRAGGALEPAAPELIAVERAGIDSVDLTFRTPSFRADGSVPLANLDAIRIYRDGAARREIPLFTTDTGRTITIRDAAIERGYYRYHITALDTFDPQNESASSDTLIVYAGSTDPYAVSFDSEFPPRFLMIGEWGLTTAVSMTPPNSLTDSPAGEYKARSNSTVQIFPVRVDPVLGTYLSFDQIVVVDPTDSAIVEYRFENDTAWTLLRSFTWNDNVAWSDSVADPGDWQPTTLGIPHEPDDTVVTVRFRLKTNIFRHGDGWYIDNIQWSSEGGVRDDAAAELTTTARPNPFTSAAIIEFTQRSASGVTVRVVDLVGRVVRSADLGRLEPGRHTYTLDGSDLVPGTYLYEISSDAGRAAGYLMKAP
jgi:hypothetical protein